MRTSSVVSKGAVGLHDRTALDRSRDEGDRVLVVPRLREKRTRGEREECNAEGRKRGHLRAISWALGVAASVWVILLAGACSDLDLIGDTTVPTAELLILALQSTAPTVQEGSFSVPNSAVTVRRLLHSDAFNTLYLEVRFPEVALASLNGQPLTADDTVLVTAQPRAGGYGLTLSPQGLEFAGTATPSVTLSYARYGDLSVADGSDTYATRTDYESAPAIWFEVTPGLWRRVEGSGPDGADAVSGPVEEPGTYAVAAPR